MKRMKKILSASRGILIWYAGLVVCCFGLCYLLAGPYDLINRCDGQLSFFTTAKCDSGIRPIVVRMNAETLDPRVESLMPPLSFTPDVGFHLMGTDILGRDVFAGILYGGQRSLIIGFMAGALAMVLGWIMGITSVYVQWQRWRFPYSWVGVVVLVSFAFASRMYVFLFFALGWIIFNILTRRTTKNQISTTSAWWWGRWIEWYQALPDLLLLLVLSSAIGQLKISGMVIIIMAVVWPSMALLARRIASEVSRQPFFTQAVRNRVSGYTLWRHYLWGNTSSAFWALLPLVVARIILLESTISFLGMGLPPDVVTIGSMISSARYHLSSWWLIVFSCIFIFILVYPLMKLGTELNRRI